MEHLPKYLSWKEEKISDFSETNVTEMYNKGFVFTRIAKGVMHQTRSIRIDLSKFELTSENRRILKKVEEIKISEIDLPYVDYEWSMGKLAKDFYDTKFGDGIFSAQKVKEVLTSDKNNFNVLFNYSDIGFAICYFNKNVLHYSYPFYDLEKAPKDMGLGMMIKAIVWAKEKGLKFVYLGSLQRPGDVYKLQFEGLEWFDGKKWKKDLEEVKEILKNEAVRKEPLV